MNDAHDKLAAAARLLVEIAGPQPVHIEMSARGPKKYYEVHRPFGERDGRLHLLGWKTKGATLRHPDGMTRALCYDADTPDDWQLLQEAARALAEIGYVPVLEASPVGRGGHLWIIYTGLISAAMAKIHVLGLAPLLEEIGESWPGAGSRTLKVRLPGGKYVQPGFCQWCTLADAHGTLLTTDGQSGACVLLDYQTPVTLVPNAPQEPGTLGQGGEPARLPNQQDTQAQSSKCLSIMGKVDVHWHKKYSQYLWFQFTPGQLATLFNEWHPVPDMLKLEQNGMAFSPSVPERTPSTAITKDGRAWVDFSARVRRHNGKHDGGDALELVARRNGETRMSKAGTMREIARDLVREAKAALEDAARAGEPPPVWVTSIMTEAGWQHYLHLCGAGRREIQTDVSSTCGLAGFDHATTTTQAQQQKITPGAARPSTSAQAAPSPQQSHDTLESLAAEIGADIGEPCNRCGCTLSYQSGPYRMCHWCYPLPIRFGRLSDEQRARLRAFIRRRW